MNTDLNNMLKHLVNGEEDSAQQSFHDFVKDKMRTMMSGQPNQQVESESLDDSSTSELDQDAEETEE